MISKTYGGNEGSSECSYTEAETFAQFNLPKRIRNGEVCLGVVMGIDHEKQTADVFADGRRWPNAAWSLPHHSHDSGQGIDFEPKADIEDGAKHVVVSIFNDQAHIIGTLPHESKQMQESGDLDPNYAKNRDDLEPGDIKIKSNQAKDTSLLAKASGMIKTKAEEFCQMTLDATNRLCEIICDEFKLRMRSLKIVSKSSDNDENALTKIRAQANDLENGEDMLRVLVGKMVEEGQPQGQVNITMSNTDSAPDNELNLSVEADINISTDDNMNLDSESTNITAQKAISMIANGGKFDVDSSGNAEITSGGKSIFDSSDKTKILASNVQIGDSNLEPLAKADTLQDLLETFYDQFSNHTHEYLPPQDTYAKPAVTPTSTTSAATGISWSQMKSQFAETE